MRDKRADARHHPLVRLGAIVTAVLSETDSRLVDAYLRHYATGDDSLLWAFSEVNDSQFGWEG
jgi:hypothetical protein